MSDAFEKMDRMYRIQRYFYDATRKFYLLGRDQLLDEINIRPGESVLEAGCGTARNLIILAMRDPEAKFYGLDASDAMLETAQSKIAAACVKNIELKTALADEFTYNRTFGRTEKFDKIFFSYSISMIPPWRESIENALANLKPGGRLYVVDFDDQRNLPSLARRTLTKWLSLFGVKHVPGLIPYLEEMERSGKGVFDSRSLYRSYSFIASFMLSDDKNILTDDKNGN